MGLEIERKFLVRNDLWRGRGSTQRIVQGYLCVDPERTVRVRIAGDQAWITIKGVSKGAVRVEHEFEVPLRDAEEMLSLCLPGMIEKIRHEIREGGHLWEVDEFAGANEGLVVAEIELADEDEPFERPDWLGMEVTQDSRYTNARLSELPFSMW